MKCKIAATLLKSLINSLNSLQELGLDNNTGLQTLFSLGDDGNLIAESSNMGAYIRKRIPVKVLRSGQFGINIKALSKCKLSGDVTLDYNDDTKKLRVTATRAQYTLASDQTAEAIIKNTRLTDQKVPIQARVPAKLLADAVAAVTLKPGLKQEKLRIQFAIEKNRNGGKIEVVGLDEYSYGRFMRNNDSIKVKSPLRFALQSSSPKTVLREVQAETIGIGFGASKGAEEPISIARFCSTDTDIYYPVLEVPFMNTDLLAKETTSGKLDGAFVAYKKQIQTALNTVKSIADSNSGIVLYIKIGEDGVKIATESADNNAAVATLQTEAIDLGGNKEAQLMRLNYHYTENLLKLTPDVVPLRIESWEKRHAIIRATKIENGLIEYFMAQVNLDVDTPEK